MAIAQHWEQVYRRRDPGEVSWFEPSPKASLRLIEGLNRPDDAGIIDIGGGASRLAGELVRRGNSDVTVADISPGALIAARSELGDQAQRVEWVIADARDHDFGRRFDVWHDRAVFHFMVDPADRAGYLETLSRSLEEDGDLIIATFGPSGPTECSGLPVRRYGAEELAAALGAGFRQVGSETHVHETPSGREQQFLWARFKRL